MTAPANTNKARREAEHAQAQREAKRVAARDQRLLIIAKAHLDIHTFERQRSGADFQEQAVWTIQAALEAAYEAGRASAAPNPYRSVAERRREITGAAE